MSSSSPKDWDDLSAVKLNERLVRLLTVGLLCATAAPVSADSTLTGSLTQRGIYDSSPRLASTDTDSVSGYILEPRANLDFVGERWDVSNGLRLTFPFYDNDDFNLTEQRYDLTATRALPRGDFSITGTLERGSTLTNGLVDELDGIINDNNELIATRRNSAIVRPQWAHQLTERNQVIIGGSASIVDFEDRTFPVDVGDGRIFDVDAAGQLSDYRFDGADITFQRALSQRTNVFATAAVSRFRADERVLLTGLSITEEETSNFSRQLQLGVTHAFSPTVSGTFRAGGRIVDSETDITDLLFETPTQTLEDDSSGGVFDAELNWTPERMQVSLLASRTIAPSGIGQLLEQDRVSLLIVRELRPGLTARLRAGYIERSRVAGGVPFDREVVRVDPTLRWRFREHWAVAAGARYASVRDANGDERDGVRLFVNLIYDFSRSPIFR
ncbi:MAG: hypothetical protein AAF184_03280 [Pseudomonadota bacterium]